ncbi:MAG: NAD(P)/FAD-dependent oxidoreductase [Pseudomonadota bacterium]|uniref:NAD(P)/FAD-dependent oxidoreductase n=1 Tax=Alcanivorax sp. TaxID=1872427 RepID=UPI00243F3E98|nr:NAD(P)/FAD-dependent oxidoreductase [Alcanivorax sp.]MED5239124.1 NAD(P)/FAD-dependent oxidoreductase [Pseudomonadota bacterium]MEE3321776.1 NAD(P)/FAD-dependent oxidoreductase [Pseudomonadota bacterium]
MAATTETDIVVIGAGAAGLMCAATAAYQGHRVQVLDHANKAGKKILMSGGGRCNFTNLNTTPEHFVSANPHFCKSALKRYSPWHFVELVERHGIEHVEKAPGQLFCAESSKEILAVLLTECEWAGADIALNTSIKRVTKSDKGFTLTTSSGTVLCQKLVVACGGLSIPTMGATGFGYQLAEQFGLTVLPTRAGLVPFTLQPEDKAWLAELSGISTDVVARTGQARFAEPMLITHRGLSGPAMLQVSSFWAPGQAVTVDWLPQVDDPVAALAAERQQHPNRSLERWLRQYFSQRLAAALVEQFGWQGNLQQFSNERLASVAAILKGWSFKPAGTEGYRTAEVTLGGVDTDAISSKNFEVKSVPGLHFIGEVLDVTGQLGGFNFQWAWASGWCTGLAL